MVATFNGNSSTTIISCYSLTNASIETNLDTFYNELFSFIHGVPKHNVRIISGNVNAQIGKNVNNKFSLHNWSNRNGKHQTNFTLENGRTCLHTKCQKRKGKLWTYTCANNAKTQTTFLSIRNGLISLWIMRHTPLLKVSFDHGIVTAKVRLCLRWNATQTTKTAHYDWSQLNNRNINDKYTITLRNKFDALQEISETLTPNDEYENFVNAHMEAAAKSIPTKLRAKHRVPWETLVVKKKRNNVKTASLFKKRNLTNDNVQKLKKAQSE